MPASMPASGPRETAAPDGAAERGDEALLLAFGQNGDLPAFDLLYRRHERPVYRFLLRSVAIPAIAEDLLQDTWMAVARNARGYTPRARFTTWLYTIARTRLIDHWRAHDNAVLQQFASVDAESGVDELASDDTSQPERIAMNRAQARAFTIAVEQLPPAQRETFMLHADAGLTLAEIAAITGAPVETIKSRFRYACNALRPRLQEWRQP